MRSARAAIDVERRLPGFSLSARLELGSEVLVLFGPSGAGKTMLLDVIAGLAAADAGRIVVDGATLFCRGRGPEVDLPARRRRVGYLMQHHALFPHMTALANVAYPLRRSPDAAGRALALLERVSMAGFAERRPAQLSGGQRQRVALARALATGSPLLLLDEPFAALDGPIRSRLQADLRALQRELGLVVLLVTHQLEDAFAMGDRIAVMRHGRIEQIGAVADVFRRPASRGVAEIMGIRNLIRARVTAGGATTRLEWDGLALEAGPAPVAPGDDVTAYIPPEDVKILYPDRPIAGTLAANVFDATLTLVRHLGSTRTAEAELPNGRTIELRFPALSYGSLGLEPGARVRVALRAEGIVVLEEAAGDEATRGLAASPPARDGRPRPTPG